jgi:HSP20 family protein
MTDKRKELKKREAQVSMETERTRNRKVFVPKVDIIETESAIELVADMPGVNEKNIDIDLEKGILTITGVIEPEHYKDQRLVYAEYEIGDYQRSFSISDTIDQDKIEASIKAGVLRLTLPKVEPAKARKIKVNAA